ncbi:transposase [Desulfovibrio sulfodismutans]|uniref:Transposase n=1 Tax=Desulfolutivibrio sulfodismutans TaxID=63561 RepID=A0A7K3NNR6_9BACT|nr:DDE-type integrase/transposase/recombinase [Desulfolutivibrio sulfodismutans]NDY57435.1 transposase [Desulfolutivibrio sulfodismutans]QLA11916.1 DDE-type integrase/transposase/recombinase [Desulfolutivibrio sulfodismutans DSM 3696]
MDQVTAKNIAQALHVTERAAQKRAETESWPFDEVTCRGGRRRLYRLDSLPSDVRVALAGVAASEAATAGRMEALRLSLDENLTARAATAARQSGLARYVCLNDTAKGRASAKAAVLAAYQQFLASSGLAPSTARAVFAAQYSRGQIAVDQDVREDVPRVSPGTLRNWETALTTGGLARLAGNYGHRRGSGLASRPEVAEFITAMLTDHPHASSKHIRRGLISRFGEAEAPSLRALQRFVETWKRANSSAFLKISNPDKWRSTYQCAFGSASADVVRLNQRWEIDSTKGDVMLADGKRHNVVQIIDVYSRRVVYHVSRTSSAAAVAACLRRAVLAWGAPEELVTDNGSDYVSRRITDALLGLGITQRIAPPFTPEAKPHVERAFGTFSHDLVELLPGYIGHNVAERQDIEARKSFAQRLGKAGETVSLDMSPEDFQAICDRWAEDIYARDPHEGLGGKSPLKVAADWRLPVARPDARALDVLLSAPADGDSWRTVRKKGLKIDGRWHIHAALGPIIGQRVRVLLDESDVGAVYVFAEAASGEMEFICRAVDPATAGISRQEIAAAKAAQKKAVAEETAKLRASSKTHSTKDIAREILHDAAAKAGKLTVLPPPTLPHETPMLREAGQAARATDAPTPRPATEAEQTARAALAEDMRQAATVHQLPESPRQRYARWRELDSAIQAGTAVTQKDRKWWESYRRTSECSAQAMLREMVPGQAAGAQ